MARQRCRRPGPAPTHHAYRKDVERIAADPLGSTPSRPLDLEAARAFVARLRTGGYAVGTIRNTRARLRQIADCAVDLGYIAANPVGRVKLPRQTAEERTARRTLEPAEVARLLATLDGNRPADGAVALLVTNGLRASEALGLGGRTSTSTPPRPRSDERARIAAAGSGNASTAPRPPAQPAPSTSTPAPSSCSANAGPPRRPTGSPPGPTGRPSSTRIAPSIWCSPGGTAARLSARSSTTPSQTPATGLKSTRPGSGRTPAGAPR